MRWKAASIGVLCSLLLLGIGVFVYLLFIPACADAFARGTDVTLVLEPDMAKLDPALRQHYHDRGLSDAQVERDIQLKVAATVGKRLEFFEAARVEVEPLQERNRIKVSFRLPEGSDIPRAGALVCRTAYLTFHIAAGPNETAQVFKSIEQKFPGQFLPFMKRAQGRAVIPAENIERIRQVVTEAQQTPGLIPADKKLLFGPPPRPWEPQKVYSLCLVNKEPIMTGEGLSMAAAIPDDQNPPSWKILFGWDATSAAQFGKVTAANIGKPMGIVLDDVCYSAPVIRSQITSRGEVTGGFGKEEAQDLAIALQSGQMPVPLTIVSQETPTEASTQNL